MKTEHKKTREEEGFQLLGKKFKLPVLDQDEVELEQLVKVNFSNLENQAEELPFQLQWVGILQAKAERLAKSAETSYKVWWAKKDRSWRKSWEEKKKKYTEREIEGVIRRDPEYTLYKEAIHEAEEKAAIMRSVYWALQQKATVMIEMLRKESGQQKLSNLKLKQ
jgi:hypothetical protein